MSEMYKKIKERREELDMTQDDLARATGYTSRSSIAKIESGYIDIPQSKIYTFAKALKTTVAYLMGWNEKQEDKFNRILTKLPFYNDAVSAGGGTWLSDGHEYEWQEFENVPQSADFALKVRGDSMEPNYSDGDIVFVKSGMLVESWHVGVFVLNGQGYMKMLQGGKLVSANNKYKPIIIDEEDSFYIIGRVVGMAN